MKNYLFLAVMAAAVLASCSEESFVGDEALGEANGQAAISFNLNVPAMTRADRTGGDAATDLGNQFIVYAEKSETGGTAPSDGNLVIKNYIVNYGANTAYTTTSNTKNWEYVGLKFDDSSATPSTENYSTNVTPNSGANEQTIKYWDYSASNYVFTAVSANKEDITSGRVKIQKNTSGSTVYDKGYTITLAKVSDVYPSLSNIYFAKRNVISQGNGTNRETVNAYGGNVTMRFSNLLSHVRAGVYEDIPGYDITEIKFYVDNGSDEQTTVAQKESTNAFGAICSNITTSNYVGKLTVTYYSNTDGADVENSPKVTASGTAAKNLILGTNLSTISPSAPLGTTSNNPTWDTSGGTYSTFLPQINNSTSLKLKADYKLYNSVTKEVINVTGATAEVPAQYLQWKPNYKYTYLFKITDDKLYPITFDAVVIEADDGQAEYITTVSEPSITTFGVKGGKYSVGKSEYEAGMDIYATIMDAGSVVDFTLGTNVNVYKATTTDATNFPITEASVAESIAEIPTGTKKITVVKINSDAATNFTAAPEKVTTVPAEDGTTKTINALKLTGAKATTATEAYVIEYVKTAATYNTTGSTYTDATAFSAAGTLYTNADGTTEATSYEGASTTYYKRTSVKNVGVYAYKVIHVAAMP